MAAVRHHNHHHHIQAPKPTWIAIGSTPPAPSRGAACRKLAAHSPLLLPPPPSVWHKDKRPKDDDVVGGGVPASPRISCMGRVKGGRRRCSSARGPATRGSESDYAAAAGGGGGSLAGLVMELCGRRRGRKSRACSKVRNVPSDSSSSSSLSWGSNRGVRTPSPVRMLDPPLPVVGLPARDDNAPSLWERRRGGGKALNGLVFA